MKRLSHMTCPSMVHPGGRAGALRVGGCPSASCTEACAGSRGAAVTREHGPSENWPQSPGRLVWWGAETYSRRSPPARRGSGWFTTVYVSDAFGGPAWMLLDSAQKCDRREVCWPRDTRPLSVREMWSGGGRAQFPGFFHGTNSYCAPTCAKHASRSQEVRVLVELSRHSPSVQCEKTGNK